MFIHMAKHFENIEHICAGSSRLPKFKLQKRETYVMLNGILILNTPGNYAASKRVDLKLVFSLLRENYDTD